MTELQQQQLLKEHLSQFVTEHKRGFMERVLASRTRYLTIVLEDIYQSQNTSAVIRTCECMGLQDVHVIETNSEWSTNKLILKGSNKWLNIIRYRKKGSNNTADCFEALRSKGYRIAVTDPAGGVPIDEVPLDRPLAIVMGNERHGSSPFALQHADLAVTIPMAGFTESMNISVSAAICLHTTLSRLRRSDYPWPLSEEEKEELRLQWYRKSVRNAEVIEREFLRSIA
ncbi:MAG: RNA methyltransferase [Cyclobacteriaceae bacterium]|nr:RNA methyltransferase [Cyclobacteriaceae bacterium]